MYREEDRKLLLFLSVDLAGSTEYKNRRNEPTAPEAAWPKVYESFYLEFPSLFARKLDELRHAEARDDFPEIWKCLGDEIIFVGPIQSPAAALWLCRAFYFALIAYDESIRTSHHLRVKGTAWTAGFPIRNTQVRVPRGPLADGPVSPQDKLIFDYIGPDVDIGFRLGKWSRPGRLVGSMDLVDILTRHVSKGAFRILNVSWEQLPGAFGGRLYPIFWLFQDNPPIPRPWEVVACHLTRAFLELRKEDKGGDFAQIREAIDLVRNDFPDLMLFEPYFDAQSMPEHHRKIWQEQDAASRQETNINSPFDPLDP